VLGVFVFETAGSSADEGFDGMSVSKHRSERGWIVYTACVGGGFWLALVASVTLFGSRLPPLTEVAPLLALALAGEELVVRQRARAGGAVLSFSAIAHIAAAIMLGPLAAASVAAIAVVVVDGLRPAGRRFVVINSAMFGLSIWVAGACYQLVGGGKTFHGIGAILPLLVLVSTRYLFTTLIFGAGVAVSSARRFREVFPELAFEDLGSAIGEGSLGILVAFGLAARHDWIILPFLVPLLAALYQSKATLQQLKDETAQALGSFAHVVDARDPSTAEHTERVAASVDRFLELIEVPERKRELIVAAAKFHDLGKVAVEVATLSKPGRLSPAELDTIRRHPRLSAFLLSPFHFAREMATFVELHHERYDGQGYYAVPGAEIPLEAHLLVVADSFDAMTSQRTYRPALSIEEAARELVDKAGTQFHPLVAPAFAAMVQEQPLGGVLSPEQIATLRRSLSAGSPARGRGRQLPDARTVMLAFAVAALVLLAVASVPRELPIALAAVSGAAGLRWLWTLASARWHERRMLDVLIAGGSPAHALATTGNPGWLAWLQADEGLRYSLAELDSVTPVPDALVAEACRWAARRETSAELPLASGWLLLREVDVNRRLALGLDHRPSELERQLIERLLTELRQPESAATKGQIRSSRRDALPSRRAVFLIELAAFEQVRVSAGQLVAERVVDEAERRLRQLLRCDDSVTRIGDDKFGVAVLVPNQASLDIVRERITTILQTVPVPHRVPSLVPRIVGAFGTEIEQVPGLAALDEKLSPHARAWVAAG
jgi:GGDEF domain-containing protein